MQMKNVFFSPSGFTLRDLETLPFGIALPIRDAIYHCREQPAADWPEAVCLLIGRQDLSKQACEGNLPKGKSVSVNTKSSRFSFNLSNIKVEMFYISFIFLQVCILHCLFYIMCQMAFIIGQMLLIVN